MNADADLADIRTRLDRLEQQNHRLENQNDRLRQLNRRLKLIAAAVVIMVGAVVVFTYPQVGEAQGKKASKTVEANKFVLVDEAGKQRAVLGMTGSQGELEFLNANGTPLGNYNGSALVLDLGGAVTTNLGRNGSKATLIMIDKSGKVLLRNP